MNAQPPTSHLNTCSDSRPPPSPLTSSSPVLELFAAATAHAVRRVEALAEALRLDRDTFPDRLAEAVALNKMQSGVHRMDVGGTPFHTHREVLHRHGGMLSVMASEDFPGNAEEDEYLFLDRFPQWFPLVLQYLRTGVALVPDEDEGRAGLFREARYYSLEGLCRAVQLLQERLHIVGYLDGSCELQQQIYNAVRRSWEGKSLCHPDGDLPRHHGDFLRYVVSDEGLFVIDDFVVVGQGMVYDLKKWCPSAGRWETICTIPDGHFDFCCDSSCAVVHDRHLYTIAPDGVVKSFSMATGQWQRLPRLLAARRFAAACMVAGRLCVVGGNNPAEGLMRAAGEYVPDEQRRQYLPDMPTGDSAATAVAWEGKLLVTGAGGWYNAVLEYRPEARSRQEPPDMITARAECAAVVAGGDLMVVGGFDALDSLMGGDGHVRTVERYTRQSQRWEALPSLPETFWPLAAVVSRR